MKFIPNTRYLSAFGKNIPSQKIPAMVRVHGLELMTLQTEAMVLKQSVVFSNIRERFY